MAERNWEDFWGAVWLNLFHSLGVIAVIGGFLWFVWALAGETFLSKDGSKSLEAANAPATRTNFTKSLLNVPKPCAIKGKPYSDISRCSVFGLRLGMSLADVKQVLEGSGYFSREISLLKNCTPGHDRRCVGFIYEKTDVFSINAAFIPAYENDRIILSLSEITLWIDPQSVPYFHAEGMAPVFTDLFGAPDRTSGSHLSWGGEIGATEGPQLSAYPYKGQFIILLSNKVAQKTAEQ